MLVFTPKGNIPIVSQYLKAKNLLLDHPRPQKCNFPYYNPHHPPPQGWGQQGLLSAGQSRWTTQVSGKSVEVQRSQAEELFKSLQSGDELPECDAREYHVSCHSWICLNQIWMRSCMHQDDSLPAPEEGIDIPAGARARDHRRRGSFFSLAGAVESHYRREALVPPRHTEGDIRGAQRLQRRNTCGRCAHHTAAFSSCLCLCL